MDIFLGIVTMCVYAGIAWIVGRLWFKRWEDGYCLEELNAEISNQFNMFQREMRGKILKKQRLNKQQAN